MFLSLSHLMYLLICLAVFALSAYTIRAQIRSRLLLRLVDNPNTRSSHDSPTQSAGGLSIMLLLWFCVFVCHLFFEDIPGELWIIMLLSTIIGVIGLTDDVWDISAAVRFFVQCLIAVVALYCLPVTTIITTFSGNSNFIPYPLWLGFTAIAFVWLINLYNFMDGIDGYAASQTLFVCAITALLLLLKPSQTSIQAEVSVLVLLSVIMTAFLVFNWPKASLFMGDTGSGFIGCFLGGMILLTTGNKLLSITTWLILLSLFISDSSVALIRRLITGKKVHQAHRSHAYQNLSRKFSSHLTVTLSGIVLNVLVIAPAAMASHFYPGIAIQILMAVYAILVVIMLMAGSGKAGLYER